MVDDMLAEHARRFYASGAAPAPVRRAATVLLLRPPFEVYLIRRALSMAFAADMYAFPGGSVDPRDAHTDLDWVPVPNRLGVDDDTARAIACAAVREVFEESGVLLASPHGEVPGMVSGSAGAVSGSVGVVPGSPGVVPGAHGEGGGALLAGSPDEGAGGLLADVSTPDWEQARRAVEAREIGFAELLRERGLVLRADLLGPWSRWITPEFEPRRFDTYFFLARLPEGQLTRHVGGEAAATLWADPRAVANLAMLPPTLANLADLARCGSIEAALAEARTRDLSDAVRPRLVDGKLVT